MRQQESWAVTWAGCGPVVDPPAADAPSESVPAQWQERRHVPSSACCCACAKLVDLTQHESPVTSRAKQEVRSQVDHTQGGGSVHCVAAHSAAAVAQTRFPSAKQDQDQDQDQCGCRSVSLATVSLPVHSRPFLAPFWPHPQSRPVPLGNVARSGCLWPRCGPSSSLWSSSFLAGPRRTSAGTA